MNISQLLESLKDPSVTLSISEKLVAGLGTALISMGVVFIVLLVIASIIKILQSEKQKPQTVQQLSKTEEVVAESKLKSKNEDIGELVSVITAAIAAATGNSTNNIVVKKISRTNNSKTSWESVTKNTTK